MTARTESAKCMERGEPFLLSIAGRGDYLIRGGAGRLLGALTLRCSGFVSAMPPIR